MKHHDALVGVVALVATVAFIWAWRNRPSVLRHADRFGTKCYSCERQTKDLAHPQSCFDCEAQMMGSRPSGQSALGYALGFPAGSGKVFAMP